MVVWVGDGGDGDTQQRYKYFVSALSTWERETEKMNESPDLPYPEDKPRMNLEIYQTLGRILIKLKEIKELMKLREKD